MDKSKTLLHRKGRWRPWRRVEEYKLLATEAITLTQVARSLLLQAAVIRESSDQPEAAKMKRCIQILDDVIISFKSDIEGNFDEDWKEKKR